MRRRNFVKGAAAVTAAGAAGGALPVKAGVGGAGSNGYFYPEESRPHERTFMQWPVSHFVYPSRGFLKDLQQTIANIANAIVRFEPVVMLMDGEHKRSARRMLSDAVEIWNIPTEDLWARDSGPSFVIDGKGRLAMTHFNFNGWGGKQRHRHDGKIARRVADLMGLQLYDTGLVGEAGGAEFDGEGTLIAHASSWVNRNRNKGSKQAVEQKLLETYGAEKVIWAPGIKGADITDYHIDALARFTQPGKVLMQIGDLIDPNDKWSRAAFETHDILSSARDANDRKLEVVKLPEPWDIRDMRHDFVASYVNYYVCNGAVIASNFGDKPADEKARSVLTELYPNREIVMLNTDPVGRVGGGIHCATHEQPKV